MCVSYELKLKDLVKNSLVYTILGIGRAFLIFLISLLPAAVFLLLVLALGNELVFLSLLLIYYGLIGLALQELLFMSYANAVFDKYDDGNQDYSGKHIPYAPQNTIYARASYDFTLSGKLQGIVIGTDWNARGRTWWNEDNSLSDGLHGSLGADFSFRFRKITIFGRLDNLTDARNPVFYFKSVGNSFFQIEKPFRWHIGIRITL